MGKALLEQINFKNYRGAESISVTSGVLPQGAEYISELSLDNSKNIYLWKKDYNYVLSTDSDDDKIYMNENLSGMCKQLTLLESTDLINNQIVNYHYTTNMHTAFANCYSLLGIPAASSKIKSMYGTYYNCTNIAGSVYFGYSNINNMIGTCYNCTNLIGPAYVSSNVICMKRAFYNCTNLIGNPAIGTKTKSIEEAYYNCTNISGSCMTVLQNLTIATNAFYNCANIYGYFRIKSNNRIKATLVNFTNTFYNRNFSNNLNIGLDPNHAVGNALLNYSDSYGNIYGIGALEWTLEFMNVWPHNYYTAFNAMTNTRLIFYDDVDPTYTIDLLDINHGFRGGLWDGYNVINASTNYTRGTINNVNIALTYFNGFAINEQVSYYPRQINTYRDYYYTICSNPADPVNNINLHINITYYTIEIGVSPYTKGIRLNDWTEIWFSLPYPNNDFGNWLDFAFNYYTYNNFAIVGYAEMNGVRNFTSGANTFGFSYTLFGQGFYIDHLYQTNTANLLYNRSIPEIRNHWLEIIIRERVGMSARTYRYFNSMDPEDVYNINKICHYVCQTMGLDFDNLPRYNLEVDGYSSSLTFNTSRYAGHHMGNFNCGANVLSMEYSFAYCTNILNKGVCGPKVQRMQWTYCYSDINQAIIGPNVISLVRTFQNTLISEDYIDLADNHYLNVCQGPYMECNNIWGNLDRYHSTLTFNPTGTALYWFRDCNHIVIPYNYITFKEYSFSIEDFHNCNNLITFPIINTTDGGRIVRCGINNCPNLVFIPEIKANFLNVYNCPNLTCIPYNIYGSLYIGRMNTVENLDLLFLQEYKDTNTQHNTFTCHNAKHINMTITNEDSFSFYIYGGTLTTLNITCSNTGHITGHLRNADNFTTLIFNGVSLDPHQYGSGNNYYITL